VPVPPQALVFDLPVMLAVAVACLPIFLAGYRIARWEGGLFFGYYLAYTLFIVLTALQHPVLDLFARAMLGFVIPLTLVTLAISLWRSLRPKA